MLCAKPSVTKEKRNSEKLKAEAAQTFNGYLNFLSFANNLIANRQRHIIAL